jgi:4-carboxymuconolactone decarboxylase
MATERLSMRHTREILRSLLGGRHHCGTISCFAKRRRVGAMARIKTIQRREDVPNSGQSAWDEIVESRGGRLPAPFQVLLHSPELARRVAHLGAFVRFEVSLPNEVSELAILAVARETDCLFEWGAHVPLARKAGVREEAIAAIRERRHDALTDAERVVVAYVTDLLTNKRVVASAFRAIEQRFGVAGAVDLTGTAGYYSMIACTLNAFEVTPDAGMEQLPV